MEKKKWWKSKTLWTNLGVVGGAVAGAATGEVQTSTAVSTGVMAFVNILLRLTTTHGIG